VSSRRSNAGQPTMADALPSPNSLSSATARSATIDAGIAGLVLGCFTHLRLPRRRAAVLQFSCPSFTHSRLSRTEGVGLPFYRPSLRQTRIIRALYATAVIWTALVLVPTQYRHRLSDPLRLRALPDHEQQQRCDDAALAFTLTGIICGSFYQDTQRRSMPSRASFAARTLRMSALFVRFLSVATGAGAMGAAVEGGVHRAYRQIAGRSAGSSVRDWRSK